jgi:hypothetical protein
MLLASLILEWLVWSSAVTSLAGDIGRQFGLTAIVGYSDRSAAIGPLEIATHHAASTVLRRTVLAARSGTAPGPRVR